MKTKNILALALLPILGVLTACSNDDAQLSGDRVPITLTASTLNAIETRAAADTALNKGYMETGQTIKVRVSKAGADTWTGYNYTTGANGVLTAPVTPPFYPIDGSNVDIVAFYPALDGNDFSVSADQTTDDGYLDSDLMFASVSGQAKSASAVPLQFEHKMAKIIVNATAGSGVTQIQSITLQGIYRQVSFDLTTGDVSLVKNTRSTVTLANNNTTNKVCGAALIPAQTLSGELLTIVTDQGTATYTIDGKNFAAGNAYTLNIRVGRTAINAENAITDWTDNSTVSVGSGYVDGDAKVFKVTKNGITLSFTMIYVEGGPYTTLGGQTVTGSLTDYFIAQTEVTNALYSLIVGSVPSQHTNKTGTYPVDNVTYAAAKSFAASLTTQLSDQLDGMVFKLPSDAQFEYAARGGKRRENYTYAGSNTIGNVAWYKDNSSVPQPVAQKNPNSLGLYDMTGNLWEWCLDNYSTIAANANLGVDYVYNSGSDNLLRCGAYSMEASRTTVTERLLFSSANASVGFRIVLQ